MTELVRLSGIRKNFAGVQALKGVDFDLKAGEVHALVGENGAGKSTLMRLLAGEIAPTSGTVSLNGEAVLLSGPRDATGRGISVIHQELALAPDLTVAENIFLGRLPGFVNHAALRKAAREILDRLGFSIDPAVQAGRLTVAHQQVVEIAKALSNKARIIVFDEPTAVLANSDAERLLAIIRELRVNGTGIVYISHRLNEVFDLSDRITVMKDGSHVETLATAGLKPQIVDDWQAFSPRGHGEGPVAERDLPRFAITIAPLEQGFAHEPFIAVGADRIDPAFVDQGDDQLGPVERHFRQRFQHRARRAATRDCEGGDAALGDRI